MPGNLSNPAAPSMVNPATSEPNSALNYTIGPMVYESLVNVHPTTLAFIPALATHWQISADKTTYRFRINPNARWSDGEPVTASDVVATWVLKMDKGLQDPSNQMTFGKFEKPVAESKYILSVKTKVLNWRNFLYFAGMSIFPAHVLQHVDGAAYLKDYNFKLLPGSGPYKVEESDIVKRRSEAIGRALELPAEPPALEDIKRLVQMGSFATVYSCYEEEEIAAWDVRAHYRKSVELEDCTIFWDWKDK